MQLEPLEAREGLDRERVHRLVLDTGAIELQGLDERLLHAP
jgi:hypothetical protein